MEVGESRKVVEQVQLERKVDNVKKGCFPILDLLSLTHYSLTVVDFSSRPRTNQLLRSSLRALWVGINPHQV